MEFIDFEAEVIDDFSHETMKMKKMTQQIKVFINDDANQQGTRLEIFSTL